MGMVVGGLVGRGAAALLGGGVRRGVAERDDELDVGEEAGRDLAADHHVRDGRLEADGLARQLAEQLLAEHHVLGLQLLLPVQLHRLAS